ncbi:MAG TPA: alpha-amylase family glycosyl hydrolase [Actinomycetota bacterium]|nr:alpha-amylase family glycosyl hydrolase [Actinomycetota bacterium]
MPRASRHSAKRNWYLWRDGRAGGPPNNWLAAFGGLAWTWDARTGQWYLHLFLPEQPDLNWSDAEVEGAMHDVLRFWLDRGVDGFRADVVHLIGKDEALPDQPEELARCLVGVHSDPSTHELLRRIRKVLDSYPGERAIVGEVNLGSASLLAPYYGAGGELHMVFNFSLLRCAWRAEWWAELVLASEKAFGAVGAWPVWVLSNHDVPRHRTRYGGSEARARVAAVVLLTLRGTPFLYASEELGLEDAAVTAADQIDPGGRDGCRAPIPWDPGPGHGWPGELRGSMAARAGDEKRRDPPGRSNVDPPSLPAAAGGPACLAGAACRRVAAPGRSPRHPGLRTAMGAPPPPGAAHFGDGTAGDLGWGGDWVVEVATSAGREGMPFDGRLTGPEAVVLRAGRSD